MKNRRHGIMYGAQRAAAIDVASGLSAGHLRGSPVEPRHVSPAELSELTIDVSQQLLTQLEHQYAYEHVKTDQDDCLERPESVGSGSKSVNQRDNHHRRHHDRDD